MQTLSLDRFFEPDLLYNERVDTETRNRIRLSIAAYAYEFMSESLMSDGEFDELAKKIDLSIDTRRPDLDRWFRKNFKSYTGQWIHRHPEKDRLAHIAIRMIKLMEKKQDGM